MSLPRTPSQTVGPFFHEALRWKDGGRVRFGEPGKEIVLEGRIVDGAGEPVADALVETWQLSPSGKAPVPASGESRPHGFGRVETARDGSFRFDTMMPGGPLPFIEVAILARGLLKALRTRVYLVPEAQVRADPSLKPLAGSPRLSTLVARAEGEARFRWEIRLQGEGETVFLAA
ncbi:MAG TPA: protocatechuate 3,4-dioxygenase subunit alpha [Usitatibacter sp.]|nr:protocatechuate 3,4-dioxygenase subunit alpha [Usitatibacter sp.]